jgi:hypothetical protein
MIEERLESFMEHIEYKNDKYCEYVNKEKGLSYTLNIPNLLCRVDKLELDEVELATALFKNQIENKEYKKVDIVKLIPKSEITKDKKDATTITEKKTKGVIIYNVSNLIGIHNSYDNVEDAFKIKEEINSRVYPLCK